jgi:hypothetical protein
MTFRRLRYSFKWPCLLAFVWLLLYSTDLNATNQSAEVSLNAKLQTVVKDFDNQNKSLIPTLLKLAADYHLPIGIERVVRQAVDEPITVRLDEGTLVTVLDLTLNQLPGYAWAAQDGVVVIYGLEELKDPSNFLNQTVASFDVKNETLDHANMRLRNMFFATQNPTGSYAGSYIGTPQLEDRPISLSVRNATLRSTLNRLAAAHGEVAWIVRVTPERLSHKPTPSAGLWQFLPRGIQDTRGIIDLGREVLPSVR